MCEWDPTSQRVCWTHSSAPNCVRTTQVSWRFPSTNTHTRVTCVAKAVQEILFCSQTHNSVNTVRVPRLPVSVLRELKVSTARRKSPPFRPLKVSKVVFHPLGSAPPDKNLWFLRHSTGRTVGTRLRLELSPSHTESTQSFRLKHSNFAPKTCSFFAHKRSCPSYWSQVKHLPLTGEAHQLLVCCEHQDLHKLVWSELVAAATPGKSCL